MRRKHIIYVILGIIITIVLILSCSKSVIIDMAPIKTTQDSVYIPRRVQEKDTTKKEDTTRIPITFGVTVDNWGDEENIN